LGYLFTFFAINAQTVNRFGAMQDYLTPLGLNNKKIDAEYLIIENST
jgi:hypothetical protein